MKNPDVIVSDSDVHAPSSFHGREAELGLIRADLERVADGSGAVTLIEGRAGIGKSRLVVEAVSVARTLGIKVGMSAAEPHESGVELASFLAALFDGADPLLDGDVRTQLHARLEHRYWTLRDIQEHLERAALRQPLLICIDDAQWADAGTAAAVRTLPVRLRELPIGWIIVARPLREPPTHGPVFDYLQRRGATSIALGPLEPDAVMELAREIIGGEPGNEALALVEEAEGNPFLIVEMLLGRAHDSMRDRLGRLSGTAQEAVIVAASLGRTFTFADLARLLGRPSAALLAPVDELLTASLLVERAERLGFWHDITRETVRTSVPLSTRRALDRQAADILLERGALPVEVAVQLADSAEPGDAAAASTLLEAAKAVSARDPGMAARFGRSALDVAPAAHPLRGEMVGTTAIALHVAGNFDEAITFADTALRETLPSEQEAEVRLGIAGMFAVSHEKRIAAGRAALLLPDLPEALRARHLAFLFHNFITAGQVDEARALHAETRAAVAATEDERATFALRVAQSALGYIDGSFDRSLVDIAAARRSAAFAGDDQRARLAHMWHGELLSMTDRDVDALAVAADGLAAAQRDRQGWAHEMFGTWYGRMLLRTGRLPEAAAVLDTRFELEDGHGAAAVLDAAGVVAFGRVAIHTGDGRQTRRAGEIARVMLAEGSVPVRRHAVWLLALLAAAEGDSAGAQRWLRSSFAPDTQARFPMDISDAVDLARIGLAAGDDELAELAELAVASSARRAALNSRVASVAAAAAHVRGLVHGDVADLEEAVRLLEQGTRRLELASALEDLGVHLVAVDVLGRALELYSEIGAAWDARRVRSRLRALGVRRRMVANEAEKTGWAALTSAEVDVARLVAQGLTNRAVAERLFVSPHTVNTHLRHVFAKLGINSRVELARLAA